MKRNPWLISGSVLVATWMTTGAGWAQTSGTSKSDPSSGAGQSGQTIHPSPKGSQGGSQSERTGDSGVPLPKGSAQSGTVDMGKSGGSSSGTAQSPKGFVRVQGELWNARALPADQMIVAGTEVEIVSAERMTVFVRTVAPNRKF